MLEHHLDGVAVLRRGGGARAARVWSEKERGDGVAMAALIAAREIEGGGPGRVHVEEGKEKGLRAWMARGRAVAVTRDRWAQVATRGRWCRVAHGRGRGRERGSWQVGQPTAWAPPVSERRRERERVPTGGSGRHAGPVSNGLKNNSNLIQTRPNLIRSK
jgi:hypothetical protein